uniref:Putative ribonuclease H-like domain-containing protein n=1 Tax=Tanacetum cinerariifolium TaxID=118510 RepID=A0A699GV49_TANCI|nr:putative ribonuclease H-like domain-containing protein [Tanacetum cinerariifolium]
MVCVMKHIPTSIFEDEEVVSKKEVSTADPVPTTGEVVTTTGEVVITAGVEVVTTAGVKPSKPKAKGIVIQEPSETPIQTPIDSSQQSPKAKDKGIAKMIEPEKPLKRKNQIMIDKERRLRSSIEYCQNKISEDKAVDDIDSLLSQTLKTIFEHNVEDNIWKYQQGLAKVLNLKLFDSCGVYYVTTHNMVYYLLGEKMGTWGVRVRLGSACVWLSYMIIAGEERATVNGGLPILNPNEFDLWKMRIEQYFLMTDYSLWEVILNGDSPAPIRVIEGVVQHVAPTTADQRLARKNELKAHGTFMMALPDKYLLKFNIHKDAKTLMEAIEKRLQNLISQLEVLRESLSQEDINLKFLRSLPTEWRTHTLIWRNKTYLEEQGLDDLFNNLKIYKAEVECYNCHMKGHFARKCRSPKDTKRNVVVEPLRTMTEAFMKKKNKPTMPSWHSPLQVLLVLTMRYHSGDGYHAVPPPYIGTFMPPKPNMVFHDAPNVNKTDHTALNSKLSPTKPDKVLSHTHRPSAPIIDDWVSDLKDDSEDVIPQNAPSFVQPTKQVKTPRPSVQSVETSILAVNHKTTIPKPKSNGHNRNRKACFVSKSLTYLIKNFTTTVPKAHVTRPRPAKSIVTKPHLPPRRNINCSPSPKASTFPPKFTAAKTLMGNPQHALKDKGVIDSGCSRHMTWNMSYLSDFEEINGGYVAFGGNPKGGKISGKDDYSRFTWVFFLATKDETSPILKTFITGIENQLSLKVKIIRSDNGTKLKNIDLNQFCGIKGIKRELSVPRTPQQNGIAERKNRTLIEAARTMLADLLLPILFWAKPVNTACYVQNRVLVTKPQNKTPYELLLGKTPSIGFMRPFGCPVTILNTLDPLGSGPTWLFDIDTLRKTMNYQIVTAGNQSNPSVGIQEQFDTEKAREDNVQQYVLFPVWSSGSKNPQNTDDDVAFGGKKPEFKERKPESEVNVSLSSSTQTKKQNDKTKTEAKGKSPVESSTGYRNLSAEFEDFSVNSINEVNATDSLVPVVRQISTNSTNTFSAAGPSNTALSPTHQKYSYLNTSQYPDDPNMLEFEDITYSDDEEDVGVETDFTNLERTIIVSPITITRAHQDHLVSQIIGDLSLATQTRSMTRVAKYQVARIKAIRLVLAYASFMEFMVYQMDVKSAFLYGTIEEEVYVCQPLGFEDPDYPDKVYKVVKALYGLHQAPRAWYETLANYLLENGFQRGKIDQTLFIKRQKGNILLIQIYVDDIIFCSTNKDLCKAFKKLMKDNFQMSSIGELTFFLGLQVKQKLISWQYKKQTVVATSSTEAEYVATVNDVLRLQALVDKKKAIITEATIRDALRLNDAESIDCLHNEEIFTELSRMGYEKPSTKLTFYKAFFSPQWKFLIHTILHCMSAKRTSWNEFSSSMASAVICLSTGRKFNFSMYIFDSLVRNVDSSTKFYMYPRFLYLMIRAQGGDLSLHSIKYSSPALIQKVFANMRKVGKGFSRVDAPLFEGMIVAQQDNDVADEGDTSVAVDDVPAAVDESSIPSRTPYTQPPPRSQDIPCTSQVLPTPPPSPISQLPSPQQQPQPSQPSHDAEILMDLVHTLLETCTILTRRVEHLEQDKIAQSLEITKLKQRGGIIATIDADKDVTLKDVAAVANDVEKTVEIEENADDDELGPAELKEVVEVVTTAKLMTEVVTAASATITVVDTPISVATLTAAPSAVKRRKRVVIRDHEETTTPSIIIHSEAKSKDKRKEILVEEPKPLKKQAQIEQDEAYARELEAELNKNINWDEVIEQVQRKEKEDNAMMRNMAGFKMDYFKGMKYDDIRPIFEKSFNSNVVYLEKTKEQLEEEDSRALKRKTEMPNDEDDVYTEATPLAHKVPVVDYEIYTENNKPYFKIIRADGTHQLFLRFLSLLRNFDREDLEKKRYPLTRFTLDQMLNNVRLEVEEESEVSLELLRFKSFPPLDNPELTIRRRPHVDPTLLNDFEMASDGNGDPPVPDLQTMEELCKPTLNGRAGPIAPIAIQATNFRLKNDMIQQVQNSCQFHGLLGHDANKNLDKFLHVTQSIKVNGVSDDALRLYLFPHTLKHHATGWFDRLLRNSNTTFEQMAKMFLRKYFPPSTVMKLRMKSPTFVNISLSRYLKHGNVISFQLIVVLITTCHPSLK